jgi:hypothetical protein
MQRRRARREVPPPLPPEELAARAEIIIADDPDFDEALWFAAEADPETLVASEGSPRDHYDLQKLTARYSTYPTARAGGELGLDKKPFASWQAFPCAGRALKRTLPVSTRRRNYARERWL